MLPLRSAPSRSGASYIPRNCSIVNPVLSRLRWKSRTCFRAKTAGRTCISSSRRGCGCVGSICGAPDEKLAIRGPSFAPSIFSGNHRLVVRFFPKTGGEAVRILALFPLRTHQRVLLPALDFGRRRFGRRGRRRWHILLGLGKPAVHDLHGLDVLAAFGRGHVALAMGVRLLLGDLLIPVADIVRLVRSVLGGVRIGFDVLHPWLGRRGRPDGVRRELDIELARRVGTGRGAQRAPPKTIAERNSRRIR